MILIFYEIMTIPFRITFELEFSDFLDNFINGIFCFDILINFNTAIYIKGELVINNLIYITNRFIIIVLLQFNI